MPSSPLDAAPAGAALRPIAATIAVVIRDGEVLLVRRANRPDAGRWGFPGGKIDPGETLQAAAVRELFEETQVRGEARRILTALDAFDHDEDGSLRQHFILIAVLCRWIAGEPVAGDDALEGRWFSVAGLASAGLALSRDVVEVAQQATALAADGEA